MVVLARDSDEAKRIDGALREWRQGDVALQESWFVHVGDPRTPLSEASSDADADGIQALESEVAGLVIVTQTCDIVRSCTSRPYVEVTPLVKVSQDDYLQVVRGQRPAHAALPAVAAQLLVADLDRVMTVEKAIVANWERTPGCVTDADGRRFAQALARKRVRFAFPDDFTQLAKGLQRRLRDKHQKLTDEGQGLRALREIRVQASPSWDANQVSLFFWFVREHGTLDLHGNGWADLLADWLALLPINGRFVSVDGQVVTLQDMTAEEFVDSDPLDLDHLSSHEG
ncbi:MAG: hypothetical protein ACM3NQ_24365 [Bacteroidales bacterium]